MLNLIFYSGFHLASIVLSNPYRLKIKSSENSYRISRFPIAMFIWYAVICLNIGVTQ